MFRKEIEQRDKGAQLPEQPIDRLEAQAPKGAGPDLAEIFADVRKNRLEGARKTLAYLNDNPDPQTADRQWPAPVGFPQRDRFTRLQV